MSHDVGMTGALFGRMAADELRFLRQERDRIIRTFTEDGFRKPYDSEPLSAYVNSFVAAQMRSVRDALEGNDRR